MFDFSFLEVKANVKKQYTYDIQEYLTYCKDYEIEPSKEDMMNFFRECIWQDFYQGLMASDLDIEINEVE
jgi:hypothetical protein